MKARMENLQVHLVMYPSPLEMDTSQNAPAPRVRIGDGNKSTQQDKTHVSTICTGLDKCMPLDKVSSQPQVS